MEQKLIREAPISGQVEILAAAEGDIQWGYPLLVAASAAEADRDVGFGELARCAGSDVDRVFQGDGIER